MEISDFSSFYAKHLQGDGLTLKQQPEREESLKTQFEKSTGLVNDRFNYGNVGLSPLVVARGNASRSGTGTRVCPSVTGTWWLRRATSLPVLLLQLLTHFL